MSTKKFIVSALVILAVLLATLGVKEVVASHNKLEEDLKANRLQLDEKNKVEAEMKSQLEKADKEKLLKDQEIQKLNEEKKELDGKLQAKVEAKAEADRQYAIQLAAQKSTVKLASAHTGGVSHQTGSAMWCTDWVYSKRGGLGMWGNAGYNWISGAQAAGLATGTVAKAGAVAVTAGHVAYVESVNGDGSFNISEMGWNYQAGNYNERTVSPGEFGGFIY